MITTRQIDWAAGFLEGEGSFSNTKKGQKLCVEATQVQKEPLDRLVSMFGGKLYYKPARGRNQEQYQWQCTTSLAAGLMMMFYPLMSPRRKGQILKSLALWRQRPPHHAYATQCPLGHPLSRTKRQRRCLTCHREDSRRLRVEYKAAGKCLSCGAMPVVGKSLCSECEQKNRANARKFYEDIGRERYGYRRRLLLP